MKIKIEKDTDLFVQKDNYNRAKTLYASIGKLFREIFLTRNPISFLFYLLILPYIFIMDIVIYITNIANLLFKRFEIAKVEVSPNISWTRGIYFRLFLYFIVLINMGILLFSRTWGVEELEMTSSLSSNGFDLATDAVLLQNSTTATKMPEDRLRIDIVQYTTRSGDSLDSIGKFFGVSTQTLLWVNNLPSNFNLQPGFVLKIPPQDGVVKPFENGDTIETFAKRWGGNAQAIIDANWLDSPYDKIAAGRELFVPNGRIPDPPKKTYYTPGSPYNFGSADPSVGQFLSWPVQSCRGSVSQWVHGGHVALDISDGSMPTLVAAADGFVSFAGCHSNNCPPPGQMVGGSGAAWAVEVNHENGYTTLYAHMYSISVVKGQRVKRGDVLGIMGMTGSATGIHVHFELWREKKWNRVSPLSYMIPGTCGKI